MAKVKKDKKVIAKLIAGYSSNWQKEANKAITFLYDNINSGKRLEDALKDTEKQFPQVFKLKDLENVLIEAAAHGYGLIPSAMTSAQVSAIGQGIQKSWTGTGMTLSKKLHSASMQMREAVIQTVGTQLKNNKTWKETALALFDGYGKGQVLDTQEIAAYMRDWRRLGIKDLSASRKALLNINRLASKGSPTQALKAAYTKLLEVINKGSDEAIKKALNVAVMEKSRYIAERIARTESARAWADGFFAETLNNPLVVAYKWKLGSRHPQFDQCDLYAGANLFGLGSGVFPKNKLPPIPAHPHCGCRLIKVFKGEVDPKKAENKVAEGGGAWIEKLTVARQKEILGTKGREDWLAGENWQKHMKGWKGLSEPNTRLQL